ncbi:MAG: hypothetical protein L6R36_006837 [Xanthoria steineri]|nr:MAG: hypothetical protein L6R36_006837 [Xanthoria steineri]
MSTIHHAHLRTSPPQARKTAVKAARPAAFGAPKSFLKGNGKVKQNRDKPKEKEEDPVGCHQDDDDDDMATSFLQFCVTCDRQILVPNNSLLYCSERCKRMDAQHVSDYSSYVPMKNSTTSETDDGDRLGSRKPTLVPRAVPTPRPAPLARIPPEAHEGKSDLDPTEWKPKLAHRPTSDASKYLSQFHHTPPAYGSPRRGSPNRSVVFHTPSMDSIPAHAPSLSATPSASCTSSSSDSIVGTPYDFSHGPSMPNRPNPVHSRSVDLVTPHRKVPTAYSVPVKPIAHGDGKFSVKVEDFSGPTDTVENGDLSYAKRWNLISDSHGAGSGSLLTTSLGGASLGYQAGP